MKKLIVSFLALVALVATTFAQEVGKAIVEYNGQNYPAFVREYPNSAEVVTAALKAKMEAAGNKITSDKKDWLVYRGGLIMNNGQNIMSDMLIKVEPKSRSEKNKSIVYFIPTTPGAIPVDRVKKSDRKENAANIDLYDGGTNWLNESVASISNQQYLADIAAQQAVLDKSIKKLKDLEGEKSKLEKRLAEIQKDLEQNRLAIEAQKADTEKEKAKLESIRAANPGVTTN